MCGGFALTRKQRFIGNNILIIIISIAADTAKERMKSMLVLSNKNKKSELNILLNGQKNSSDAIKLEQFCKVSKSKVRLEKIPLKDMDRIQNLIE